MVRTYFVVNWTTWTTSGHARQYYKIFEGDNPNDIEQKARIFTQFKTQNRRSYNITLVRFDETTIKPGYTDETGKYHLPKQRTTAITLFK